MKQMLPKVGKNGAMLTLDNVSSVIRMEAQKMLLCDSWSNSFEPSWKKCLAYFRQKIKSFEINETTSRWYFSETDF
jgi:hypothetical protein